MVKPASIKPTVRAGWIISPWADMLLIVATPLLIVPIVWPLHRYVFTPVQISLFVFAFATLGHHLPGFMRAYGDRDLLSRFRWRFWLAPPAILATALLFMPPPALTQSLGNLSLDISWDELHGLNVVIFFWASWHGLMQTYGFMRIYDMKRGINNSTAARFDFWLCIGIFAAGIVFSPSRVYEIMKLLWQSGVPTFDPVWLTRIQWTVGAATAAIVLSYIVYAFARRQEGLNWVKILLAATTGGLYWFTGSLTTNVVIGVAMFEIFHAMQYYSVVWVFNRRLAERDDGRSPAIAFLFRPRASKLALYLLLIAGFGSIYFLYGSPDGYLRGVQNNDFHRWLTALFITSTILHYYYDGFIWKVREAETRKNLDIESPSARDDRTWVPGLVHLSKWAVMGLFIFGLLGVELREASTDDSPDKEVIRTIQIADSLSRWTPELPLGDVAWQMRIELALIFTGEQRYDGAIELMLRVMDEKAQKDARIPRLCYQISSELAGQGNFDKAKTLLEHAKKRYGDSPWTQLAIGYLHLEQNQNARAIGPLKIAAMYKATRSRARYMLGDAYMQLERYANAEDEYRQAVELNGEYFPTRINLARALQASLKFKDAEKHLRAALRIQPDSKPAKLGLINSLLGQGKIKEAVAMDPDSGFVHLTVGNELLVGGDFSRAVDWLQQAVRRNESAPGFLSLGKAQMQLGDYSSAVRALQRASELDASNPIIEFQLGVALELKGDFADAIIRYRKCLKLNPDYPQAKQLLENILSRKSKKP